MKGQSTKATMCLLNITDREVKIPKLQRIASVQPTRTIELYVSSTTSASEYTFVSDSTSTYTNKEDSASQSSSQPPSPPPGVPKDVPVQLDDTDLTENQKSGVQDLLRRYSNVFAFSKSELSTAKGTKHSIRLTDPQPFKDRPKRMPPANYKEDREHIGEMLACGAIRRLNSP